MAILPLVPHLLVEDTLGCYQFLLVLVWTWIFHFSWIRLGVDFLGHVVTLIFDIWYLFERSTKFIFQSGMPFNFLKALS